MPQPSRRSLRPIDAEFRQFRRYVVAVGPRIHVGIDEQNLAFLAEVKRHPGRMLAVALDQAVGFGRAALGIAENRVVEIQRFGEFCVGLRIVATRRKVGDVELADFLAALTERLTFGRSTTGESLRKPSNHNGPLVFEIRKPIGFAVAPLQSKVRRVVTGSEVSAGVTGRHGQGDQSGKGGTCFFHYGSSESKSFFGHRT